MQMLPQQQDLQLPQQEELQMQKQEDLQVQLPPKPPPHASRRRGFERNRRGISWSKPALPPIHGLHSKLTWF
jgi:hypothetical protein